MKILICGASGLVGRVLFKQFINNGIECIGTYNNNKTNKDYIKIDFLKDNIFKIIKDINPDIIINCIAERQNEICENDWNLTKKINIDIPNNISRVCGLLDIFMIHLSTDYVYDGQNPPFTSSSETNPLQNYGISKLIGEKRIIANIQINYLILRIPVLYSNNLKSLTESAIPLIIKKLMNRIETFKEDNYSLRRPLYIEDLTEFILKQIFNKNRLKGIQCFYNPYDKYTKYEILKIGANILNKSMEHIYPIHNKPLYETAIRPKDTNLLNNLIDFDKINITRLDNGLDKILGKFKHPKIDFKNIPSEEIFYLFDFDGTILDNELFNFKCYHNVFLQYNIILTYSEFIKYVHLDNLNNFIIKNNLNLEEIKNKKYELMDLYLSKYNDIKFKEGFLNLLDYLIKNNLNYCIVSNSSKKSIEIYKKYLPKLNLINNWILKEDYYLPKPSPDCYKFALNKYYNNEKYIIGFEDSIIGFKSLKNITHIIYILTNKHYMYYNDIKKEDVYLIENYFQL